MKRGMKGVWLVLSFLVFVSVLFFVGGQESSSNPELQFESKFGNSWKISIDKETKLPNRLIGGNIPSRKINPTISSVSSSNIEKLTRDFLDQNKDLLKVDSSKLKVSNKDCFSYSGKKVCNLVYQKYHGSIPYTKSFHVFTTINNNIVYIKTDGKKDFVGSTIPKINKESAIRFAQIAGKLGSDQKIVSTSLEIFTLDKAGTFAHRLAYRVELPLIEMSQSQERIIDDPLKSQKGDDNTYSQKTVWVDAETGEILDTIENVRSESITGKVQGKIIPNSYWEEAVVKDFKHNSVKVEDKVSVTNEEGGYQFDVSPGEKVLIAALEGPWVKVFNKQQDEAKHEASLQPPAEHNWEWSEGGDTSYKDEESNVFYHTNIIHDYLKKSSLNFNEIDYQMRANVNLLRSCNAYYHEKSINFYKANDNCESTALSADIIYHEYTHGLVDALIPYYPYWEEPGNINEGVADYVAATILEDPCLTELRRDRKDSCHRPLINQMRYPRNFNPEPHSGTMIITGSFWDMREKLKEKLGNDKGVEYADALILHALAQQPYTYSEYLELILVQDDDNGNLADGTPNIDFICTAFSDNHGIYSAFCQDHTQESVAMLETPSYFGYREDIYRGNSEIEILGSAYAGKDENFINYLIEYKKPGSDQWVSIGITLANDGLVEVGRGSLGKIDTRGLEQGLYHLRLVVNTQQGARISESSVFIIDMDRYLFSKMPLAFVQSPVYPINLDEDDFGELFVQHGGTYDHVYAFEHDGTVKWWWDDDQMRGLGAMWAAPVIADLDADGKKEIIASSSQDYLYILDLNGNLIRDIKIGDGHVCEDYSMGRLTSPAAYDLDNNGDLEIITADSDGKRLYIYEHTGDPYIQVDSLWPVEIGAGCSEFKSSPAFGDIDKDGDIEIIIARDGTVYAFEKNGKNVFGWPVIVSDQRIDAPPTLADMNGDGYLEIFIQDVNGVFFVLDYRGNKLFQWNSKHQFSPWSGDDSNIPISIGDIDGNGDLEIVGVSYVGEIYVKNHDGSDFEGWPQFIDLFYVYGRNAPILADVDGDGDTEIFVAGFGYIDSSKGLSGGIVYGFDSYGNILDGWPKYGLCPRLTGGCDLKITSSPSVYDLDNDGALELIVGSWEEVYAWSFSKSPGRLEWPMFQHDIWHTGLYGFVPDDNKPPVIIDNLDLGFSKVGTWASSGGLNPYNGGSLYAKTTSTSASWSASWTASLTPGRYEVYAWWTEWPSRSTGVQYEVYDRGTRLTQPSLQNQRMNGGKWNLLGVYDFTSTGKVTLKVKNDGASYNADAVKFVKLSTIGCIDKDGDGYGSGCTLGNDCNDNDPEVNPKAVEVCDDGKDNDCDGTQLVPQTGTGKEIILDNSGTNTVTFSKSGYWSLSSAAGSYGTQSIYSKSAGSTATWTTPLNPGRYDVYAWWTEWSSRTTAAPYSITHSGGTSIVNKNQKEAGSGGKWNLLGSYDFGSTGKVVLTSKADGTSYNADAIKFVLPGTTTCVPVAALQAAPETGFIRGDVDGNGRVELTDAVRILNWLFQGGQPPACEDSSDADDNGRIDITDAILILNHLFSGGAPPKEPNQEGKGFDSTRDELECD